MRQAASQATRPRGAGLGEAHVSGLEIKSLLGCRAHSATPGPDRVGPGPRTFLYHLPELVQRAQLIRPWLVSESLRPVGPRHLADIEVAVVVHRKPMRRQELGWTKARAKPA